MVKSLEGVNWHLGTSSSTVTRVGPNEAVHVAILSEGGLSVDLRGFGSIQISCIPILSEMPELK